MAPGKLTAGYHKSHIRRFGSEDVPCETLGDFLPSKFPEYSEKKIQKFIQLSETISSPILRSRDRVSKNSGHPATVLPEKQLQVQQNLSSWRKGLEALKP